MGIVRAVATTRASGVSLSSNTSWLKLAPVPAPPSTTRRIAARQRSMRVPLGAVQGIDRIDLAALDGADEIAVGCGSGRHDWFVLQSAGAPWMND